MSFFRRLPYIFSLLLILAPVLSTPVLAAKCDLPQCELEKKSSRFRISKFGINLPNMIGQAIESIPEVLFDAISGRTLTEVVQCEDKLRAKVGLTGDVGWDPAFGSSEEVCKAVAGEIAFFGGFGTSPIPGSALGMAYGLEHGLKSTPPPVNLAYFWNRTIEDLPIANKALAADVQYNSPLLDVFYSLWQLSRNVSLALMSVILLIIGIMIILRKKVNQQAVVTIQYAIPRIVVSFILILFSYPIGGIMASLGWNLFSNAWRIVFEFMGDNISAPVDATGKIMGFSGAFSLLAIVVSGVLFFSGAGVVLLTFAIGLLIVLILMFVYLSVKAFLIYLKLIMSIMSAPIEFVIAAIPGSETRISAWFKRMAIYVLTLFGMGAMVPIGILVSFKLLEGSVNANQLGWGYLIGMFGPVFAILYCFGAAIRMETTITKFIDPDS